MPLPLPGINVQVDNVGTLSDVKILPAAVTLKVLYCIVARSPVSFSDYGRAMRDIVLGVLCRATTGLLVAIVGDFF